MNSFKLNFEPCELYRTLNLIDNTNTCCNAIGKLRSDKNDGGSFCAAWCMVDYALNCKTIYLAHWPPPLIEFLI